MIKFNGHAILPEKTDNLQEVIDRFRSEKLPTNYEILGLNEFLDSSDQHSLVFSDNFDQLMVKKNRLKPCLFISHKQQDYDEALRIAHLAHDCGYDIYLDVLDPLLQNAQNQKSAILMANLIELGLLNSTHLIAVMTPNTTSSRWVPYEFGRVKEHQLLSYKTSSWAQHYVKLPEYLYLCPIHHSERQVKQWLKNNNPLWMPYPANAWPYGKTKPIPN